MSEADPAHEPFMRRAIELARKAWGETHPNPMVGALIVEGGRVVAEGWHRAAGRPHAEVEALRALGRAPSAEATLYVTLEPCSTCGRTGACTDAILESRPSDGWWSRERPQSRARRPRLGDFCGRGGLDLCAGVLAGGMRGPEPDLQPLDHARRTALRLQDRNHPGRQIRRRFRGIRAGSPAKPRART